MQREVGETARPGQVLDDVRRGRDVAPDQVVQLEAIIHGEGRPAYLVHDKTITVPASSPLWAGLGGGAKLPHIQTGIRAVGRIDVGPPSLRRDRRYAATAATPGPGSSSARR